MWKYLRNFIVFFRFYKWIRLQTTNINNYCTWYQTVALEVPSFIGSHPSLHICIVRKALEVRAKDLRSCDVMMHPMCSDADLQGWCIIRWGCFLKCIISRQWKENYNFKYCLQTSTSMLNSSGLLSRPYEKYMKWGGASFSLMSVLLKDQSRILALFLTFINMVMWSGPVSVKLKRRWVSSSSSSTSYSVKLGYAEGICGASFNGIHKLYSRALFHRWLYSGMPQNISSSQYSLTSCTSPMALNSSKSKELYIKFKFTSDWSKLLTFGCLVTSILRINVDTILVGTRWAIRIVKSSVCML